MSRSTYLFFALLTGVLLCAAHGLFAGIAWIAPIPLLYGLLLCDLRSAFYMGLVCGLLEAGILFGLSHAGIEVFLSVALLYGLSRIVFCLSFVAIRDGDYLRLLAPVLWVLLEWSQAQLPFTLPNLLGDTLHGGDLFGVVRLGGTYLLSGLVVWAAAIVASCLKKGELPGQAKQALMCAWLCTLCVCQLVGTAFTPQEKGTLSVSLVQGGIPTWLYMRGQHVPAWQHVSEQIYTKLTHEAPASALTIWAETAVDETFRIGGDFARRLESIAQDRGALLVGSRREDEGGTLYNAALLLGEGPLQIVDKKRLAIRAESRFALGETPGVMTFRNYTLGVVFCLESVVPHYAMSLVEEEGADLVVVLADGSRFGNTPVGRMHAQRSTLRAVESGRSVVHVGQHGFSHVVSALGTISEMLPPFEGRVLTQDVKIYAGVTPYQKARHAMCYVLWSMLLAAVCLKFLRKHQNSQ